MTQIRAEVRYNSKLSEIERSFAIPLVEVGQHLVPVMQARVQRGQAAQGMFSTYGSSGDPTPDRGLFWVPPELPQPAGYVIKATTGSRAGWAGYDNYEALLAALGKLGRPKDFTQTRELWIRYGMRVNGPARVKLSFYGGHKRSRMPETRFGLRRFGRVDGTARPFQGPLQKPRTQRASEVAFLASRDEAEPLLMPTRQEVLFIAKLMNTETNAKLLGVAAELQAARGLQMRANKLARRLPAQALGRR